MELDRSALVRRGLRLNYLSIGYMTLEALVATIAGLTSGSVALFGFGLDSVIELAASAAAQWWLRADKAAAERERVERITRRAIAWSFVALATYIILDGARSLWLSERPERSLPGIAILSLSADHVAALGMVPIIMREGVAGLRSRPPREDCC